MPKVSVVIPLYNAEAYIDATLRSILRQSLDDIEIIVVDDGSTDDSATVVATVADPRVRLIRQNNSGGPARPRNVGCREARGELIALFDADDLMAPEKLERAYVAMRDCPRASVCISDFGDIDSDGQALRTRVLAGYPAFQALVDRSAVGSSGVVELTATAVFATLLKENFVGTSSVVFRKTLLQEAGGFDETLLNSDDRDLWFRWARAAELWVYIDEPLHVYRRITTGISHRGALHNAPSQIAVLERQRPFAKTPEMRRDLSELLAERHASMGYALRCENRPILSLLKFLRAFLEAPRVKYLGGAAGSIVRRRSSEPHQNEGA